MPTQECGPEWTTCIYHFSTNRRIPYKYNYQCLFLMKSYPHIWCSFASWTPFPDRVMTLWPDPPPWTPSQPPPKNFKARPLHVPVKKLSNPPRKNIWKQNTEIGIKSSYFFLFAFSLSELMTFFQTFINLKKKKRSWLFGQTPHPNQSASPK